MQRGGDPISEPRNGISSVFDGDHTADEVEFLRAMDRYKRERQRPFPTWSEVLGVLKSLGYRKVDTTDP